MITMPEDVAVVLTVHNALAYLPPTLAALHNAGCPPGHLMVVDVASTDGCQAWLQRHWPELEIMRLEVNHGPGQARNLGITHAKQPYVLLLDADVRVESTTIALLRDAMARDPAIAICNPVVVYAKQPDTIQYAGSYLHFIGETVNPWQGRSVEERGDEPQDIGIASGCAPLVARDAALQIGLFDERYFKCKEDTDFSHRIKLAGYRIVEVPQARVHHDCRPRGTDLFYYQLRNRWHLMLKSYQLRTLLSCLPILLLHECLQCALLTSKGHGMTYVKALLGLIRMLPGLMTERARIAAWRVQQDAALLVSGPIEVRQDLLTNALLPQSKVLYDRLLQGYWRLLTHTILRS